MLITISDVTDATLTPNVSPLPESMAGHSPMQLSLHSETNNVHVLFSFADPCAATKFFRQALDVAQRAAGGGDEPF